MNNAYPVVGANLSQTMFKQNEKLITKTKESPTPTPDNQKNYSNVANLPGVVNVQSENTEMYNIMPAYVSQARMSTHYQNNPWNTLLANQEYGVEPLGGPVNLKQPPGYRPGNIKYSNN
jgi:hypothetical protein